jgi:hypothetical protein
MVMSEQSEIYYNRMQPDVKIISYDFIQCVPEYIRSVIANSMDQNPS